MHDELQKVIMSVYDAALDPAMWPSVLDRIAELSDARGAFIFDLDSGEKNLMVRATHHTTNYDPSLVSEYLASHNEEEMEDQEKFAAHSSAGDQINLVPDEVLAENRAALMQRSNAITMASYGIYHRAGALLNKDNYQSDRFALQFSKRAGQASGARLEFIQAIMPHIAKSLNMGRRAASQIEGHAAVLSVLNHLRIGVCILSSRGDVILKNSEFDRQIDESRAFQISSSGRLLPYDEDVRGRLVKLCGGISDHGKYGARPRKEAIFHPFERDGLGLCIDVAPLSGRSFLGDRGFDGYVLFSLDASQPQKVDTAYMARSFGLTRSEEAVLKMLTEGLTNAQISERRGRSQETVNTQIKNVLSKTMLDNRTQLLRLATEFSPGLMVNRSFTRSGDEGVEAT